MTETASPHGPQTPQGDILLHVLLTLLTPMFLIATGGDPLLARTAALETVNAYRSETPDDLLSVAQIVGFGLAALGSLSLAMEADVRMTLRLRGNANACTRAADLNRRARRDPRPAEPPAAEPPRIEEPSQYERDVIASVEATQQRVEQATVRTRPAAEPVTPAPARDPRANAIWAASMARVAAEFTAKLPTLPPAERLAVARRVAALTTVADNLLAGGNPSGMLRPR